MISRLISLLTLAVFFAATTLPAANAVAQENDPTSGEQTQEGGEKKKTEEEPDC